MSKHGLPYLALIFLSILMLTACSDGITQINNTYCYVVLDYQDKESLPDTRFSVFVETTADVRKVDSIKVTSEVSEMEWVCNDPLLLSGKENKKYAGYTNFAPASGSRIPTGNYDIEYNDAAGNLTISSCSVNYPSELMEASCKDYPDCIKNGYTEKIIVFNKENQIIFYGDKKKTWSNNDTIKNDFPGGKKYRTCYKINGGSVLCLMPVQSLDSAESETENSAGTESSSSTTNAPSED